MLDIGPRWPRYATKCATLRRPSRQLVEGNAERPILSSSRSSRWFLVGIGRVGMLRLVACDLRGVRPRCFVCDIRTCFFCSGILRLAKWWGFAAFHGTEGSAQSPCSRRSRRGVVIRGVWCIKCGGVLSHCPRWLAFPCTGHVTSRSRDALAASAEVSLPKVLSSPVLVCGLSPVSSVLQH